MLLLVLSGWKVFAQSLAIPTWDRPDIRLDQSSGLTDLYVKDYLQDQYGFVWIAAHQAVQRFDGMSVRPLFLGNDDADMLFVGLEEDRKRHHLWVASLQALYQVDLSTMQVLQKLNSDSHAQWQGGHVLSVYLDDSDRLWIGKNEGFSMIDLNSGELQSGTFHFPGLSTSSLQFARQVYAMIQDPHDPDMLWFGTAAGLVKYNHRQDSATRFSNQTFGCTRTATIHHVFYCPQTNTIVHSNDTQTGKPVTCNFLVFDLTTESYVASVSLQPEWKSRGIYAADRDRLWLSTDQGTAVYHVADDRVEEILTSPEQEFPARVDYVDANGKIWSTGTRAIHIYDGKPPAVQHYYYNTDRPKGYHVCSDLLVDGQSVYMSVYGGDGLYVLDLPTGTWRVLTPPDHQDQPATAFMGTGLERALDGSIIALSNQGIYRVNSGADALVPLTNLPGYGEGIIDRNGILWTYQSNALVRNHLVQGVLESFPAETSDCVNRRRAFRPRTDHMGNLWFLGICEGFIYYPLDERRFYHSRHLELAPEMDGYIVDVVVIDSLAYLLSESLRLGVIDLSQPHLAYQEIISLIPHLPEDVSLSPTRAVLDSRQRIWILSTGGMIRFDPTDLSVEVYNEADGLIFRDLELSVFSAEQMAFIDDNRMIYSTRKGLHLVHTHQLGTSEQLPQAYLSGFLVHNDPLASDSSLFHQRSYRLKVKENYLTFEFSAIGYHHPASTEFAHMLEGVEEDWVVSNRTNVTYSYLPGGDYCLRLKARAGGGEWGPVFTANVFIQKKWHEIMAVRALLIVMATGLAYLIYRMRVQRAVDKQRLKTQYERELAEVKINALTAQMNPHFIFNSLNSIDYFIIKNDTHRASDYLNRFARLIRMILNHSRSNYISLRDDLEALRLYIEIESLRFDEKFHYTVQTDNNIDLDHIKIPPMLFQPYVENAIWHGLMHKNEKGCITVKVHLDDARESLICTIEDNGIGRRRAAELRSKSASQKSKKSMGMTINQDKIDLINHLHNIKATVNIEDLHDAHGVPSGTRVTLVIPI